VRVPLPVPQNVRDPLQSASSRSEFTVSVVDFRLEDRVRLRKPHACGGSDWRVVRLGADIGLKCLTCQHRVLLERRVLERRLKAFLERGPELDVPAGAGGAPAPALEALVPSD
jgi:hypothetical protein